MLTIYAIPNCNTVKKARNWLEENGIEYQFHDYKKRGVPAEKMSKWLDFFGRDKVLNRAGMTWRKLSDDEKLAITDDVTAIALMIEKPSIIKRPLIEEDEKAILLGFNEVEYTAKLLSLS